MPSSFVFDSRIDELDRIINSLKELEDALERIVEQFESILEKAPVISEESDSQGGWMESKERLKKEQDRRGVILISGKRMTLITKEQLPKVLSSKLRGLVEYKIDTVEERSALEKLLSTLEKKKRTGK